MYLNEPFSNFFILLCIVKPYYKPRKAAFKMAFRAGEWHAGGRSICFLILLNVVLFSAGVTATQEENKVLANEEQPVEVHINHSMYFSTLNTRVK